MFRAGLLSVLTLCSGLAWAQGPDTFDDSEFEGPADRFDVPLVDDLEPTDDDELPESEGWVDEPEPEDEDGTDELEAAPPDEAEAPPAPRPTRGPGSLSPRAPGQEPADRLETEAAEPPPPPPAPGPPGASEDVVSETSLRDALKRRAAAMMGGDLGAAELAATEILELKRNLGLRNVPLAAALLLHDARTALDADRVDVAVDTADLASRIAPDLPATHWTLTTALVRQDPTQVVQIGSAAFQTLRAWVTSFRNAVTFWGWVLASIGFGFMATAVGFAAVQAFKHLRYPAYDISKRITGIFGSGEFVLLLWTIILVPYALGLGFVTSVVVALGAVFAYQSLRERIATVIALIGLAITPPILEWSAPFVAFHGSQVDALAAAYSENVTSDVAARLDTFARRDSAQRSTYARINAHRARQRGDLEAARKWYEAVVQEEPTDASALNNLAILQYLAGDQEDARASFDRAARSGRAEPRLNLSLLLADEGQFTEADALLVQARKIDPGLTEAFTSLDGVRPAAQRFVEVPLPDAFLWARFFDIDPETRRIVARELWRPVGGSMPRDVFPAVVLAALLAGALLARRRSRLSVACSKCGRPAPGDPGTAFCEQCVSVFVSGVAVEPRVRQRKEVEVRRYQRRRRWVERLLGLTGLGLVAGDRPLQGMLLTFIVAASLGAIGLLPLLGVSAWATPVGAEAVNVVFGVFGLGALAAALVSLQRTWVK